MATVNIGGTLALYLYWDKLDHNQNTKFKVRAFESL